MDKFELEPVHTESNSQFGFWLHLQPLTLRSAWITQLIQIAVFRRRLRLAQIQGDSLP